MLDHPPRCVLMGRKSLRKPSDGRKQCGKVFPTLAHPPRYVLMGREHPRDPNDGRKPLFPHLWHQKQAWESVSHACGTRGPARSSGIPPSIHHFLWAQDSGPLVPNNGLDTPSGVGKRSHSGLTSTFVIVKSGMHLCKNSHGGNHQLLQKLGQSY